MLDRQSLEILVKSGPDIYAYFNGIQVRGKITDTYWHSDGYNRDDYIRFQADNTPNPIFIALEHLAAIQKAD
jgi:hypothetical protein